MSKAKSQLTALRESHPKIATEWSSSIQEPNLTAENVSYGSNKKVLWICSSCSTKFERTIVERTRFGDKPFCRSCKRSYTENNNSLTKKAPQLKDEWSVNNAFSPDTTAYSSQVQVYWKCRKCKGEWKASVNSRTGINKTGCPLCSNRALKTGVNDLYTLRPDLLLSIATSSFNPKTSLTTNSLELDWVCNKCGVHEKVSIRRRAKRNISCKSCSLRSVIYGVNDLYTQIPELASQWDKLRNGLLTPHGVTPRSSVKVSWSCISGHSWSEAVSSRVKNNSQCPSCFKRESVSKWEKEVSDFLLNHNFSLTTSDRTIIKPYELDIVIPSHHIALECNGLYWHSDSMRLKMQGMNAEAYHAHKKNLALNHNYKVLFIWEDDWSNQKENIKENLLKAINDGVWFDNLNTLTKG